MLYLKLLAKFINITITFIILFLLIASIGTAITKEPVLLSVIRSNSMYPVFERGDIVLIRKTKEMQEIHIGDIVVFKTPAGNLASKGWIIHRVMDGSKAEGFITQGDANAYTDQIGEGSPPIQPEWISSRAITIGEKPLVIPFIGHIPLWVEAFQTHPLLLPGIAMCLALIIAMNELFGKKKKSRRRKQRYNQSYIYIIGGMTITLIIAGTMIASSQQLTFNYGVAESSKGVLMNSNIGIMQVGDEVTRPLTEINNNGFFPLVATITSKDDQFTFNIDKTFLSSYDQKHVTMTVNANEPGQYSSQVHIGLFFPFLPVDVIYFLAAKSYWLALITISLIPSLPLIFYPFFDYKMRGQTKRDFQRGYRELKKAFPA